MRPWLDRAGRFSALKAIVFALLWVPGLVLAWRLAMGGLGARPIQAVSLETGEWTIRLLLLTLAVTPLRQLWRWPGIAVLRRMIGVGAFAYAAVHLAAFAADKSFDLPVIVTEIVSRVYLAIGAVALAGLAALAATSTDGMVRRLGGRAWRRLHRLVYAIAILGTVHFFLQAKLEVVQPIVMAGLLAWLLACRLLPADQTPLRRVAMAGLLAGAVGLAALGGEMIYYWLAFHADPARLLAATLSLRSGLRPGWIVLAVTLLVTAAGAVRLARPRRKPALAPAT